MANKDYQINITVGDSKVSFDLEKARSVQLTRHTLIYLVEKLKPMTDKEVHAEIVHWETVPDGDCVSKEAVVIFSI